MANVAVANYVPATNADSFSAIWKLTRAMKKAGWIYKASSDGTAKETTGNPANDKWLGPTSTGVSGSAASLTTRSGDDTTVTGLTGMTANSVGRYLTITGAASAANNGTWQIVTFVSSSSVTIRIVGGVASDANNGAISWTEKDDILTSYGSLTVGSIMWWCAQGPSTLKVPFTALPTGTFLRGENVTQGTTGAQGEVLGVTFDTSTLLGYMVIAPRLSGSGAGRKGWDGTHVITGDSSGATVTPSATPVEYVHEVVFVKVSGSLTSGQMWTQCVDAVGESASRFSVLAASAGCTATVAPGLSGTGNTFPTAGSFVVKGNQVGNTGSNWHSGNAVTGFGAAQLMCANNIESVGVSADGSLTFFLALPGNSQSVNVAMASGGFSFQRCDNNEEGDVDPYIWWNPSGTSFSNTRARTNDGGNVNHDDMWKSQYVLSSSSANFFGWRRRGNASADAFQEFTGAFVSNTGTIAGILPGVVPGQDPEKLSTAASTTYVKEPIWIVSSVSGAKMRKGTCRWMFVIPMALGVAYDTYESKKYFQTYTGFQFTDFLNSPLIIGPYDGVSTPVMTVL